MAQSVDSRGPEDWILHHIGVAVKDAVADVATWTVLGYQPVSDVVHDPMQGVNVLFLGNGNSGEPLIELVEAAKEDSPVDRFVGRTPRLYHLCFEVAELDAALLAAKNQRWLVLQEPVPAEAFGGRRIAWCYTKSGDLIELLEGDPTGNVSTT